MWTIQKTMDEGTAEPFIARLMFGILMLRDQVIQVRMASQAEPEPRQKEFDDLYGPVLDALFIMRRAAAAIRDQTSKHQAKVISGDIIGRQGNAVEIHESINSQLQDELSRFLNSAVRAIKSLQAVTSYLGLNIGGFFANAHNYERQIKELETAGHDHLVTYLRQARVVWSERLVARRNALEHEGWILGAVQYPIGSDGRVHMVEPTVDSEKLSEWVTHEAAHVLAFVENVLVYAIQRALPSELMIVEVPRTARNQSNPERFRVSISAIERAVPWVPRFEPAGFE